MCQCMCVININKHLVLNLEIINVLHYVETIFRHRVNNMTNDQ